MKSRRFRATTEAGIICLAVVACMAACSPKQEDPHMKPAEALAEVTVLIEAAQRMIGGEWEKIDSGAQVCRLPSGIVGAAQSATRLGHGIAKDEQKVILDRIVKDWTDAGYPPAIIKLPVIEGVEVTRLRFPESGRGEDGIFLEVQVADTASSVDTRSRCVPGSAAEINRGDAADSP